MRIKQMLGLELGHFQNTGNPYLMTTTEANISLAKQSDCESGQIL